MNIGQDWLEMLKEFHQTVELRAGHILVIGCSTSEVAGEHIGTAGSEQIAEAIYQELDQLRRETGIELAFQCCEHLNRALVVEEEVAYRLNLEIVAAVPVRQAGGSMATHAYQQMEHPVLVESISAHAGIDIGDTFILYLQLYFNLCLVICKQKQKNRLRNGFTGCPFMRICDPV